MADLELTVFTSSLSNGGRNRTHSRLQIVTFLI